MIQVNHDYDDKQGDTINWEDHQGLANEATRLICINEPRARRYFSDIVNDMKVKLWHCARPKSEGGGYDPAKARFSTYAMTAMLRYWTRELSILYLDRRTSESRGYGVTEISLDAPQNRSECLNLHGCIGNLDESVDASIDRKIILEDVMLALDDKEREALVAWCSFNAKNKKHASRMIGVSGWEATNRINGSAKIGEIIKQVHPKMHQEIIEVIGGVAV